MALTGTILRYVSALLLIGLIMLQLIACTALERGADEPRGNVTHRQIHQADNAVAFFKAEYGKLPNSADELVDKGIMVAVPNDGWGNPLQYDAATGEFWAQSPSGKRIDKDSPSSFP